MVLVPLLNILLHGYTLHLYLGIRRWTAQLEFSLFANGYSFATGSAPFMPTVSSDTCVLNGNTVVPQLVFAKEGPMREPPTAIEVETDSPMVVQRAPQR